jgi:hypothetical protein
MYTVDHKTENLVLDREAQVKGLHDFIWGTD